MSEPNTRDLDYQIATMTAAKNGATIQSRIRGASAPWRAISHPGWDWINCEYRVVPEPKTFWLVDGSLKLHTTVEDAQRHADSHVRAIGLRPAIIELVERDRK